MQQAYSAPREFLLFPSRLYRRFLLCALSFALAGCGSLPRLVPDMAQSSANVKVSGANGPLAKEKARAVIEKIKRANPDSTMLERHLAIEEAIVGQPLIVGNRVTLLEDGKATFAAVFEAIKRAKKHVNVESYIIEDDEIGQQFADLLIAKQGQGVHINLIYDSVGSSNSTRSILWRAKANGGLTTATIGN